MAVDQSLETFANSVRGRVLRPLTRAMRVPDGSGTR